MAQAQGGESGDFRRNEFKQLLRSLLISSKNGIVIRNLQKDYYSIMGCSIPFRELKASSLEELLKSMPDVVRLERNYSGDLMCYVVVDEKSKHIDDLVKKQKSNASRPKKPYRRRVTPSAMGNMTPFKRSPASNRYNQRGQSNYNSSYSSQPAYQSNSAYNSQLQQHAINQNFHSRRSLPRRTERPPRLNRQPIQEEPRRSSREEPKQSIRETSRQSGREESKQFSREDPKQSSREDPKQSSREDPKQSSREEPKQSSREEPKQSSREEPKQTITPIKPLVNGYGKDESSKVENTTNDKKGRNSTQSYEQSSTNSQTAYFRFKQQSAANFSLNHSTSPMPPSPLSPSFNDPLTPPPVTTRPIKLSYPPSISPEELSPLIKSRKPKTNVEIVEDYADSKGIKPIFKTVNTLMKREGKKRPMNMYLSTLVLADFSFQSYPNEKPTPEEANEEAARNAVEGLRLGQNDPLKELPVTPHRAESDIGTMLERIAEIVAPKTSGIFHGNVQKSFKEKYQENLPSHWLDLVRERNICKKIETVTGDGENQRYILYPLTSGTTSPASAAECSTPSDNRPNSECDSLFTVQELQLPEDDQWEVHVSYVVNTMSVYIRLVDYSQQFEDLSNQMKEYYKLRNNPAMEIGPGFFYALQEQNSYHRVEIVSVENDIATCYFIDHGDVDYFPISQLRDLPRMFLDVPYQAIPIQLTGVEFLSEDPHVTAKLMSLILDKTFVAIVKNREDPLSLNLYDTSTEEDVDINKMLCDYALNDTLKPSLPSNLSICEGYFGHVNDSGDLYLRPNINGLQILSMLTQDLADIFQENLGKVTIDNVSLEKTYVAKGMMNEWCRCLISEPPRLKSIKTVSVNFIDFGIEEKNLPVENLVELNDLSDVLVKFPAQVIHCRLHEVPNKSNFKWTKRTSQKIIEMIELTQPLSIKIIPDLNAPNQTIFNVELFKRNASDELVSVNLTLALAEDLFDPITENETLPPILKRPGSFSLESTSNNVNSPPIPSPLDGSGDNIIDGPPLIPVKIPEVGEVFDVLVLWAVKPDRFYVQSRNECKAYNKLFEEMQNFYNNEENLLDFEMVLLNNGKFYAIKHEDGYWYRGYVSQIASLEPVVVVVNLVDYGEFIQVTNRSIQQLWKRFRTLPMQAIKAKLTGIASINYDYELSQITEFQNMVTDKTFVSIINSKENDQSLGLGGYELGLTLIDTSTEKDVYIEKILVQKGHAKFV